MGKIANRYLETHPWKLIEKGFHKEENQVSESLFSLANEVMGIRGFFEEGSSLPSLIGTYFNGLYVYSPKQNDSSYLGITKKVHFMVNAANFLKIRLKANQEVLDLGKVAVEDFVRELDFRTGELIRSFVWVHPKGRLKVSFKRLLDMDQTEKMHQSISINVLEGHFDIELDFATDFATKHWNYYQFWNIQKSSFEGNRMSALGVLPSSQRLFVSSYIMSSVQATIEQLSSERELTSRFTFSLEENEVASFNREITSMIEKYAEITDEEVFSRGIIWARKNKTYEDSLSSNRQYFQSFFEKSDIEIDGDPLNQQGIRFCLFQLIQTYHGVNPMNNIGAKGLTGEAYSGHAFWDTETYCLPFYLFNDPESAKNLLKFRHHTLKQAQERAKELDCVGACYPIATLSGEESCDLWQHASLQMQPSSAVSFATIHYANMTKDTDFLYREGIELLIEISKYMLSRGDYNLDHTKFGFFGVMGPDEFQMMVHHNTYTNYMAKRTLEDTVRTLRSLQKSNPHRYEELLRIHQIKEKWISSCEDAAKKMVLLYDESTKLFEQHLGYFELPHLDIHSIPKEDFPLYHHWTYDRIYRNDMIKQPDVLMMMFLHNQSFTKEQKRANYEFYEPRCIHESSLSPSIHSVLAMELGKTQEALDFFGFATRLDLDNYNRNTLEGLHLTSIAGAWVNIVYGFGGLRSDGELLRLAPKIPPYWKQLSFRLNYLNANLLIRVRKDHLDIISDKDLGQDILLYDKQIRLKQGTLSISL